MYKVMIVDDEKSLRNLLKATVDWEKHGLEVVGEAASGIEAINIIDILRPNIIFVDIRMPFMNGIEFSKIVMKRYPRVKIVILTAFDEFEYARECIGIGVAEYLLKPIVRMDVEATCDRLVKELDAMPKEEEAPPEYRTKDMEKVKKYIQSNFKNPDLNLAYLSEKFGFNPSYLSRRFRDSVGVNVMDYIMQCRMELAVECAEKHMYMYMTAKEVGIPDPNYFGKCFKKYTGKVYSEAIGNEEMFLTHGRSR